VDNIRSIKNLSGFRAFLIKLNNLDQPELFFQKSILDLTWLGFEGCLIQPNLILSEAWVDFPKFLDYLKPKNKTWWQQWLSD
jgi:hypothetical protein